MGIPNSKILIGLITILISMLLSKNFNISYAAKDATGADAIFELIGVEKPTEWENWDRNQRHIYLQVLGAYPDEGKKYKGNVDLELYFEQLEVGQPEDWMEMSVEERIAFIEELNNETLYSVPQETTKKADIIDTTPENFSDPQFGIPKLFREQVTNSAWLLVFFALVGSVTTVFGLWITIKDKW